jgi:hypothetical protein
MERIRCEGQNVFEVVAPQEEDEEVTFYCKLYLYLMDIS